MKYMACIAALLLLTPFSASLAGQITVVRKPHDPYGSPRPAPDQAHVPLRTSLYVELAVKDSDPGEVVLPESVTIDLQPAGGPPGRVLAPGRRFSPDCTGRVFAVAGDARIGSMMVIYVDSLDRPLLPATRYTIRLSARSSAGAELASEAGSWHFTTESAAAPQTVKVALDLAGPAVHWRGGFFTGFCGVSFCTNEVNRIPTFEAMQKIRTESPKAWSLQRDFWMTGMEHQPEFLPRNLPNIVRERETRRITAIERRENAIALRIEDFFGHAQYGIAANRPLSGDYHAGDEVLIADGVHDARARVLAVDDREKTVRVTDFDDPAGGWKIEYSGPLPKVEDPHAPGLFPPGGTYLRKFAPTGTPAYYWGRLDKEWDLAQRFDRRIVVNFADAPGDLAIDGRNWTTAKDYAELHEVVRTIAGHVIERYGDRSLEFVWSVFNEPDLGPLFWRSDWSELQRFYDYTVDGILRAFEDRGYDSDRVFVGGLELAGIFGTNLRLREFLAHCSPRAEAKGALPNNAACADGRLDGKRSKRVETLCRNSGGRGAPCDFVSIHAYNRSQLMADKLERARAMALEIDADYFAKLAVNSHESCPNWSPSPDPAYGDSYLGNGYFETWCADVARRQLQRASADPRYASGESILTFWPWPNANFGGGNDCVRLIHVDDDGDGAEDRTVTVPMPILHFLGLLAGMGTDLHVLPEQAFGGHVVSGIASRNARGIHLLLYSHDGLDTQSRSEAEFDVSVTLAGLKPQAASVTEYRFDKEHNSYYAQARALRDAEVADAGAGDGQIAGSLQKALQLLASDRSEAQRAGLDQIAGLGSRGASAAGAIYQFLQRNPDGETRSKAAATLVRITAPKAYPARAVRQIQEASVLHSTGSRQVQVADEGSLAITVRVSGNGASFLVISQR